MKYKLRNSLSEISHATMSSSAAETGIETQGSTKKGANFLLTILKILELIFIVACIGLIDDPATNSINRAFILPRTIGICYVTFGAFLIYTAVHLLMKIVKDIQSWKSSVLMSIIGAILFLACTGALFKDWNYVKERNYWPPNTQRLDFVCATASISLILCVLYILDLIFTTCYGIRGDLDY